MCLRKYTYMVTPHWDFSNQCKQTMINKYSNKHNSHPNLQEADQLAIYKRSGDVEIAATEDNIS